MNAKPQKFSEQDILSIFYDICSAVSHMHSQVPLHISLSKIFLTQKLLGSTNGP
jgi:hypothetical protein